MKAEDKELLEKEKEHLIESEEPKVKELVHEALEFIFVEDEQELRRAVWEHK